MPRRPNHADPRQMPRRTPRQIAFVTDRKAALDAAHMIDEHGVAAGAQAAALAEISRDRGNIVHFCRWRQIERLIGAMTDAGAEQTRH